MDDTEKEGQESQELGAGAQEYADLASQPERRDSVSKSFEISIDKQKLAEADVPDVVKEWMMRLPETLAFDQPITLVVGENGAGKTQFARAVVTNLGAHREGADPRNKVFRLDDDEPAVAIASTIKPTQAPQGNLLSAFIEGPEVMSGMREWAKNQSRGNRTDYAGTDYTHRLSSRQLFEQSIQDIREIRIDQHRKRVFANVSGDVVILFDEPEQGLSPQRQMELPTALQNFMQEGDQMLVPTNNLALYLSDLPRIDLSQPERGVFRPSEYGEQGTIEFHHTS